MVGTFRTILRGLNCIIRYVGVYLVKITTLLIILTQALTHHIDWMLSVPYDAAILDQLCTMVGLQEDDCSFEYFKVEEGSKEYSLSIHPDPVNRGALLSKEDHGKLRPKA